MTIRQRIRINGLAQQIGVTRTTIYRWINDGTLPKPHKIGSGTFFFADEVEEALSRTISS